MLTKTQQRLNMVVVIEILDTITEHQLIKKTQLLGHDGRLNYYTGSKLIKKNTIACIRLGYCSLL
jgi:hypothetical protein